MTVPYLKIYKMNRYILKILFDLLHESVIIIENSKYIKNKIVIEYILTVPYIF